MDIRPELKNKKSKYIPVNKKEILRADVERAVKNTKSNRAAARYLGVDIKTYKKYASKYTDENGNNLYEYHNNKSAVGVPKYTVGLPSSSQLIDIMEGRLDKNFISHKVFKNRLISEGFIKEECSRCGYHEKRVLDEKVPIILHYVDGNKKNWKLENIQFLCYNCYFLCVGDVFEKKQIEAMEDYMRGNVKAIDFDLPEIHEERIKKEINLENRYIYNKDDSDKDSNYGDDLISIYRR
jgi:hypothetical protein